MVIFRVGSLYLIISSAQCVLCSVYFSAQPNKLRPILKFKRYYPFAKASSSLRLRLQLTLPLCLLQPPRHLGVAIVAVVLERGPAAISGLLLTKLPWLRQPLVFRWKIPVLSNSIPLRHLLLGGAK